MGITVPLGQGVCAADYDNDGLIEILVNNQNSTPSLLKQSTRPPYHWIILKLTGTRSNRSALGAKVRLIANGHIQFAEVQSGGSYLSQSDLRLHFGLGSSARIDRIEIQWPSGIRQVLKDVPGDRVLAIEEREP